MKNNNGDIEHPCLAPLLIVHTVDSFLLIMYCYCCTELWMQNASFRVPSNIQWTTAVSRCWVLQTEVCLQIEMGKNPELWVCVHFKFFDDKGLVLFRFWVFLKIRFPFSSSYVNVGVMFGSIRFVFFINGIGKLFHGDHLLWINCNGTS